jgi:hypothetical protein
MTAWDGMGADTTQHRDRTGQDIEEMGLEQGPRSRRLCLLPLRLCSVRFSLVHSLSLFIRRELSIHPVQMWGPH